MSVRTLSYPMLCLWSGRWTRSGCDRCALHACTHRPRSNHTQIHIHPYTHTHTCTHARTHAHIHAHRFVKVQQSACRRCFLMASQTRPSTRHAAAAAGATAPTPGSASSCRPTPPPARWSSRCWMTARGCTDRPSSNLRQILAAPSRG